MTATEEDLTAGDTEPKELPKDAADLLVTREGRALAEEKMEEASDGFVQIAKLMLKDDLSIGDRAKAMDVLISIITASTNEIHREIMVQTLANESGISTEIIGKETRAALEKAEAEAEAAKRQQRKAAAKTTPEAPSGGGEETPPSQIIEDPEGSRLVNFSSRQDLDHNGNMKTFYKACHINQVTEAVKEHLGDDLGRVGGLPFFALPEESEIGEIVSFAEKTPAVFSHLHSAFDAVGWKDNGLDELGRSFVSKQEFCCRLARSIPAYRGVSAYPFEPPCREIYTRWNRPEGYEPTGEHLATFLNFFNPASTVDAGLIKAMVLTLFWGGPPGKRPLFVIAPEESGSQQGIGKTKLATTCASLVGGYMDLSLPKRGFSDGLEKQATEPVNIPYRVALFDNQTGVIRDDTFTKLITAPKFAGRAAFQSMIERSNMVTWIMTTNEPNFTTDVACRMAIIRLKPCDREAWPNWESELHSFMKHHAGYIALDALAALAAAEKAPITTQHSRFTDWDQEVLGCLQDPDSVLKHMLSSQQETDTDIGEFTDFLEELKECHGGPPHSRQEQRLKMDDLLRVWNELHSREFSQGQLGIQIKNAAARGTINGPNGELILERKKSGGAFWLWRPWLVGGTVAELGGSGNLDPQNCSSGGGRNDGPSHDSDWPTDDSAF